MNINCCILVEKLITLKYIQTIENYAVSHTIYNNVSIYGLWKYI